MSTRRQYNRLDRIEERAGIDSGPLLSFVDPGQEPDPPGVFASEEAARSYFDEREEEPTLVIFAPVPNDKRKE